MSGFQFFEGLTTESSEHARITVRKGGMLVLTRATIEMLGDDVDHVQIGYNPKTRQLALRKAEAGANGAYHLRTQRKSPSRLVDGKRVFRHHGLAAESSTSFDAEDFGDGLIGIRLPEGGVDTADSAATSTESAKPKRQPAKK